MPFHGLDPQGALALAASFGRARERAATSADDIARALALAELHSRLPAELDDLAERYRLAGRALETAVSIVEGFELRPHVWLGGESLPERLAYLEAFLAADLARSSHAANSGSLVPEAAQVDAADVLFSHLGMAFGVLAGAAGGDASVLTLDDLRAAAAGDHEDPAVTLTRGDRAVALLLLADPNLWSRLKTAADGWGPNHQRGVAGDHATRSDVAALMALRSAVRATHDAWPQLAGDADGLASDRLAALAAGRGALATAARRAQQLDAGRGINRTELQVLAFDTYAYVDGDPRSTVAFLQSLRSPPPYNVSATSQSAHLSTITHAVPDDDAFAALLARVPETTPHTSMDESWRMTLSIMADFVPYVTLFKSGYALATDRDVVTGQRLSAGEKAWAGATMLLPTMLVTSAKGAGASARTVDAVRRHGGKAVSAAAPALGLSASIAANVDVWRRPPAARREALARGLRDTRYRDYEPSPARLGNVDFHDPITGQAVRLLPVDLDDPGFQRGAKLRTVLERAVGQMAAVTGARELDATALRSLRLDIAVPEGSPSEAQTGVIAAVEEAVVDDGIEFELVEVRS